jgi:hypothetical protein
MSGNSVCCSGLPTTVQANVRVNTIVGCAVRTTNLQLAGRFRCARRTLRILHSEAGLGYAFRAGAVTVG